MGHPIELGLFHLAVDGKLPGFDLVLGPLCGLHRFSLLSFPMPQFIGQRGEGSVIC
jgi:hypothetical protein